jgi:hypothetical protein
LYRIHHKVQLNSEVRYFLWYNWFSSSEVVKNIYEKFSKNYLFDEQKTPCCVEMFNTRNNNFFEQYKVFYVFTSSDITEEEMKKYIKVQKLDKLFKD